MTAQPDKPAGNIRVDDLVAEDVAALLAFYHDLADFVVRAYRPYGWEITDATLRDGPIARQAAGDELGLVLRDQAGAIWGHAFLSNILSGAAHFGIGVHQKLLGRGLGRTLTTALLAQAGRHTGLQEIRLTCVQDNDAAVALYTSLGFERTGEFVEENDGLPYFRMRKILRSE